MQELRANTESSTRTWKFMTLPYQTILMHSARPAVVLVFIATLAGISLAACNEATSTARQLPATYILVQAKLHRPRSAAFTLQFQMIGLSDRSVGATTFSVSATGTLSTAPSRGDVKYRIATGDTTIPVEQISDSSGIYLRAQDQSWIKFGPDSGLQADTSDILGYNRLSHPILVSDTQSVNGVATWHLEATKAQPSASLSTDSKDFVGPIIENLWISQKNFYPIKIVMSSSGGTSTLGATQSVLAFTTWDVPTVISLPQVSVVPPASTAMRTTPLRTSANGSYLAPLPGTARRDVNSCSPKALPSFHWWGLQMYLNHCSIDSLLTALAAGTSSAANELLGLVGDAVAAGSVAMLTEAQTNILALVAVVLAINSGWVSSADASCHFQGANINIVVASWWNSVWFASGTVC